MSRAKMLQSIVLLVLATCSQAFAGGPLYVGGPQDVPGVPYRWNNAAPVTYKTDLGLLGAMTKAQADQFTADCFAVWHAVPTANITITKSGDLSVDVTASNFLTLANDKNSEISNNNSIVYDADGSLTDSLLGIGASGSVLGFAEITDGFSDGKVNSFRVGIAVLNGRFVDGIPSPEVTQDKFKETFVHEFGHFLGLDHSQINVDVLDPNNRDADRLAGLPIMFPYLLNTTARPSLSTDDIAMISQLYPAANFSATTGSIRGRVFFSDGTTQAQGYNVIARMIDNVGTPQNESLRVAVSSSSGFLFTGDAGNAATGKTGSDFGSRDTHLIGYYEIPGLPAGTYTVEVELINPSFVQGSGIGPIGQLGFQFPMPGICTKQYLSSPPSVDCSAKSQIVVTNGAQLSAGTDVVLIGTPPAYDDWESGWLRITDPLVERELRGAKASA